MGQEQNTPRITSRGVVGRYLQRIEEYKGLSWIDKIAMKFDSDQLVEEYAWLGATPHLREWIGPRIARGLRENGMTIRNKKFESTMPIKADWVRRDKTQQIDLKIDEHARRVVSHDAINLSTFIANGTGSTNGLAYDNQYFFDTDHSEGQSGTQINLLAAAQVPLLDVGTAAAPTPYEVAKAVIGVISYMLKYKDDQGVIAVNNDAREFLVMTSAELMPYFLPAFTAMTVNPGSGAVDNPLPLASQILDGFNITLAINPLLSYTTQFAVFRTDAAVKPLIIQEEVDMEVTVWDESSDYYKDNDEFKYGIKRICNWGYGLWQYATLATLS